MDEHRRFILEAQELRAMLDKSAEEGARRALAAVGLTDDEAADDVRDFIRAWRDWRAVKRGIFSSVANAIVLGLLGLIGFGVAWHMRKP